MFLDEWISKYQNVLFQNYLYWEIVSKPSLNDDEPMTQKALFWTWERWVWQTLACLASVNRLTSSKYLRALSSPTCCVFDFLCLFWFLLNTAAGSKLVYKVRDPVSNYNRLIRTFHLWCKLFVDLKKEQQNVDALNITRKNTKHTDFTKIVHSSWNP